jgi:hypothetical protein
MSDAGKKGWDICWGRGKKKTAKLTSWLQAGAADQEAVNVRLLGQVAAVLLVHRPAVEDARALTRLVRDGLGKPFPDSRMRLLGLLLKKTPFLH